MKYLAYKCTCSHQPCNDDVPRAHQCLGYSGPCDHIALIPQNQQMTSGRQKVLGWSVCVSMM